MEIRCSHVSHATVKNRKYRTGQKYESQFICRVLLMAVFRRLFYVKWYKMICF